MSRRTRDLHVWKRSTDDGRKREVRAQLFGPTWKFISRYSDEVEWTEHEVPPLEDLVELYEVLFNKYQRNRLAWERVVSVQDAIKARGGEIPE